MEKEFEKRVNSHYVPRLILNKFSDKLCLFNVKTGDYLEKINIAHAYATEGYYDIKTEEKLNRRIESQFGGFLSNYILRQENEISLRREQVLLVKKFLLVSLMRVYNESATERERDAADLNLIPVSPPFNEVKIEKESVHSYWLRTLNVILDTNGTPEDIRKHPQRTWLAFRWAFLVNGAYLAFWDAPTGQDEFVITDVGMTSENEKGWDGILRHNLKKTGFMRKIMVVAEQNQLHHSFCSQIYYDTICQNNFSENFMMFPISSRRMIVLISPFFKLRERYSFLGIEAPKLEDLTMIPNPMLFEPNRNQYVLPQSEGAKPQFHCDDRYLYDVKVLSNSEVEYCNSLFMDRIDTYLGFSDLDKIVNSVLRYKVLNSYPYRPRVNYYWLYKEIENRYGYNLFL